MVSEDTSKEQKKKRNKARTMALARLVANHHEEFTNLYHAALDQVGYVHGRCRCNAR